MIAGDDVLQGRERVSRVFTFLKALNERRNPAVRDVNEQPWRLWLRDLPDHPSVTRALVVPAAGESPADASERAAAAVRSEDFILKVRRPRLTLPPSPPASIAEWLKQGWEDVHGDAEVHEFLNAADEAGSRSVPFDEDPVRPRDLERWKLARDRWAQNERPAREAMTVFETLYELHGRIERESERVELVLGDGILSWRRESGKILHPVLLQRVRLEFDPAVPQFKVVETDHEPDLYAALLNSLPEVDARSIRACRDELEKGAYSPLGGDDTSGFLRGLAVRLSAQGAFVAHGQSDDRPADGPRIVRDAVLFLRSRTLGFASALEAILEDLASATDPPGHLLNIVGVDPGRSPTASSQVGAGREATSGTREEPLFSKPTNLEQVEIAKRLERYGCVLVQGPPGTGKTHTIANLLGHLLAQGKTVLVTSHTAKALRVVREQVVEQLRPLCVSVLDDDVKARKQLEGAVGAIVENRDKLDPDRLKAEAQTLRQRRAEIRRRLEETRTELRDARGAEYRSVAVGGQDYEPSEAARIVAAGLGRDDWIPGPVEPHVSLPLSPQEIEDLYRTNSSVTKEDEAEISANLHDPSELLSPARLEHILGEHERLSGLHQGGRPDLWIRPPNEEAPEELGVLADRLLRTVTHLRREGGDWRLTATRAGMEGGPHREPWDALLRIIDSVCAEAAEKQEKLLRYQPRLPDDMPLEKQLETLDQIIGHLRLGGGLGPVTLLVHPAWRRLTEAATIIGKRPRLPEHFQALRTLVSLRIARTELALRWDQQMAPLGAPASTQLGEDLERACAQFAPVLQACLAWYGCMWKPLEDGLVRLGFAWRAFLGERPPDPAMYGDLSHIKAAVEALPPLLEARANQIRWQRCEDSLRELRQRLSTCGSGESQAAVILRLRSAVDAKDPAAYQEAFDRLVDLHRRAVDLERRRTLLARLEQAAPAWADAIRSRRERHAAASVPGVAASAWLWRQLNDELERRGRTSLDELQRKITKLEEQLMRVTADLIERRAWHWQLGRIDTKKQQALVGWLDTIRKIGRGSGKRVPRLRAVARQRMSECRTAVPVWIMPLVRVVENFDPRSTRFDVLIIDEASQCDVMGLIALYMARAVVVVGDHEQVSPDAVGQDVLAVQNLIDVHLYDIPNAQLYDGKTSVYDLARESFPSTIRLLEHFRCVPEIIQFSNWLCYDGQIRPLRDASLVKLKPHVVAYKVEGALAKDKVNEQEAWAAASLLVAATEQPEYAGKTFGAISLVGEDQAITINRLLLRHLNPEEFSRRRIVCGNAAQFQGDERDVMFLSIVDTSDEGPLRRRDDDRFRQRFNVAASRACDQMWIVYSLDPRVDLKPGDLRRVLIEHAEDPGALLRSLADAGQRVESEFEKDVLRHLSRRGYRAVPQWKVGHYRIDLVVEGLSGRLAVECDGERAHPLEKLEEDMSRQAVLERLGWIFVRIRGSQFYRDAEAAMRPVYEKLDRLEIEPLGPELEPQESAGAVHDALIDRVVRRADELRREWRRPGAIEDYQAGLGVSSKAGQVSTSYGSRVKQPPRSIATESLEQPAAAESELRALTVAATSEARTAPIVRRTPRSTEDAVSVTRAGLQSTPRLFPSEQPVESEPVKDVTHGRRGRRSEIQPTPEDERTIAWIMSTEPGAWFSLAQWGKANEKLLPWERGLAFSIGRLVSRQMVPTVRQVRQAKRIYDETIDAGFTPEPRQG